MKSSPEPVVTCALPVPVTWTSVGTSYGIVKSRSSFVSMMMLTSVGASANTNASPGCDPAPAATASCAGKKPPLVLLGSMSTKRPPPCSMNSMPDSVSISVSGPLPVVTVQWPTAATTFATVSVVANTAVSFRPRRSAYRCRRRRSAHWRRHADQCVAGAAADDVLDAGERREPGGVRGACAEIDGHRAGGAGVVEGVAAEAADDRVGAVAGDIFEGVVTVTAGQAVGAEAAGDLSSQPVVMVLASSITSSRPERSRRSTVCGR